MNLEDAQAAVAALLPLHPLLAAVPVIVDNGTYPKASTREGYLRSNGLVFIVRQVDGVSSVDTAQNGVSAYEFGITVQIEEDVKVNRSSGGTGIEIQKAVRLVMESVCGKPANSQLPQTPFSIDQAVFNSSGVVEGLQVATVSFNKTSFVNPI